MCLKLKDWDSRPITFMLNPIVIHFAGEEELTTITAINQLLNQETTETIEVTLVGTDGVNVVLPDSIYQVLRQVIQVMSANKGVFIASFNRELTTIEASEILNVPHSFLVNLLEQKAIPYHLVNNFKRISFQDLMNYKNQRDTARKEMLTELTQMSQEAGFYD